MTRASAARLFFRRRSGRSLTLALLALLALGEPAGLASAADAVTETRSLDDLRSTTLGLIQALVDQGLLSRERADALLRQAQSRSAGSATAAAPPPSAAAQAASAAESKLVRVPYIPETLKAQIKEDIKNEVLLTAREEGWADARQVPAWVRGLTLDAEVRVRAQSDLFDKDNLSADIYRTQTESPAWAPDLTNTQKKRQRLSLRARVGLNAKLSDSTSLGARIVTDGNGSPASESQTLGTNSRRLALALDRGFVRWEPRHDVRLEAGRMAVPFQGSDLLWPDDLSLDGVAAHLERDVANGLFLFANAGAFALEEFANSKADKWLLGLQVGADWAIDARTQLRVGLGVYDFRNVQGVRENNPPPAGSLAGVSPYQLSQYPSAVRQRGNTLINLNDPTGTAAPVWGLASRFRPWNLNVGLVLKQLEPINVALSLDLVKNSAFDLDDIRRRAGTDAVADLAKRTSGLQVRAQFGALRVAQRGDWQAYLAYRKFERDAWVDAFTDTTWHLGGTNYKGYSLGTSYGIDTHTALNLRWTSTRNLDDGRRTRDGGVVFGNLSSAPLKIDVFQLDVNARF